MKEELRENYLNIRNNILNKKLKNQKIYKKIIHNEMVNTADTILIYVSKDSEVDTHKLIKYFLKIKKVAVPKVEGKTMNFYYISSFDDLKLGQFGILEPTTKRKVNNFKNVISITPGICFSKEGYRIGYGKGFYDKYYDKHKIYTIGISYKECLIDNIYEEKHDIKLNEIITD